MRKTFIRLVVFALFMSVALFTGCNLNTENAQKSDQNQEQKPEEKPEEKTKEDTENKPKDKPVDAEPDDGKAKPHAGTVSPDAAFFIAYSCCLTGFCISADKRQSVNR